MKIPFDIKYLLIWVLCVVANGLIRDRRES
jgi:hypothetical protein